MTRDLIFRVDTTVFDRFPNYVVACVAATGIDVTATSSRFDEFVSSAELRARASYAGEDLKNLEPFAAWRAAFSYAGWSASRFPASVEALHRRVQRDTLPRINPIVDLANSAVLYYSVPVGAHNIASFDGKPLEVRPATENDRFADMNSEVGKPAVGEIIYAVGGDVRTRRWVWRQGFSALVSDDATDILFPIDGFVDRTQKSVCAAQNYLVEVLRSEFAATVTTGLVTVESPEFAR